MPKCSSPGGGSSRYGDGTRTADPMKIREAASEALLSEGTHLKKRKTSVANSWDRTRRDISRRRKFADVPFARANTTLILI